MFSSPFVNAIEGCLTFTAVPRAVSAFHPRQTLAECLLATHCGHGLPLEPSAQLTSHTETWALSPLNTVVAHALNADSLTSRSVAMSGFGRKIARLVNRRARVRRVIDLTGSAVSINGSRSVLVEDIS